MERIKSLNRYQKFLLLFMLAMVLCFTVLYPITISRKGFFYRDTILVPRQENGATLYSGKIEGKSACFTVYPDKRVTFTYGDKTYGPYIALEDPSAVPENSGAPEPLTGIELRRGEDIWFRGGMLMQGNDFLLYSEDGSPAALGLFVTMSDGRIINEYGQVIDPMEPSVYDLVELMTGPQLTHKGSWSIWVSCVLICVITAVSILFADDLFRWQMSFRILNAEDAEPSEWEISARYISWTILPILSLILFIVGLRSFDG